MRIPAIQQRIVTKPPLTLTYTYLKEIGNNVFDSNAALSTILKVVTRISVVCLLLFVLIAIMHAITVFCPKRQIQILISNRFDQSKPLYKIKPDKIKPDEIEPSFKIKDSDKAVFYDLSDSDRSLSETEEHR